jgi:hypothetical protein
MADVETEVVVKRTGKRIPVVMTDREGRPVGRSTLEFTGGRGGADEAELYSFWTVMHGGKASFLVRARQCRTAEDRLNEYATLRPSDIAVLEQSADAVMPSTTDEIRKWAGNKAGDGPYAKWDTLKAS